MNPLARGPESRLAFYHIYTRRCMIKLLHLSQMIKLHFGFDQIYTWRPVNELLCFFTTGV